MVCFLKPGLHNVNALASRGDLLDSKGSSQWEYMWENTWVVYFPPWMQTLSPASVYLTFMFLFFKVCFLNIGKKFRVAYHWLNLNCESPSLLHIYIYRILILYYENCLYFLYDIQSTIYYLCTRMQPVTKFITARKCLGTPSIYRIVSRVKLFSELQPYLYWVFFLRSYILWVQQEKYCIQVYFRPVLFSPFFTCKQFSPVLNSLKHSCVWRKVQQFELLEFAQS